MFNTERPQKEIMDVYVLQKLLRWEGYPVNSWKWLIFRDEGGIKAFLEAGFFFFFTFCNLLYSSKLACIIQKIQKKNFIKSKGDM